MTEGGSPPRDVWTFHGLTEPFTVDGDAAVDVFTELDTLLPGWSPVRGQTRGTSQATVSLRLEHGTIQVIDRAGTRIESCLDPFSAAYHLSARLFEAIADAHPLGLVLHAGAIMTTTGAIAFAAPTATGKSTLAAACAMAGDQLLGDDRIVVHTNQTTCVAHPLGLAQKLRLPLPEQIADAFKPLLESRRSRRIADSLFLEWDDRAQISFGAPLPLIGIVLLDRDKSAPPRTTRPSTPEAIHDLLKLSATPGDPAQHLAAVRALVDHVTVVKLRYESCFEARDAMLEVGATSELMAARN